MLYVNGKPLEEVDQKFKDKYEKVVGRLQQASVSKDTFAVVFKTRPKDISQLKNQRGQYVTTSGDQHVPFERNVYDRDFNRTIHWRYTKTPLPEVGGKLDTSQAEIGDWFFQQDKITETIVDEELAFFLYYCDPLFGEKSENKKYYLLDARSENERLIEDKTPKVEFQYMLYGPESPLKTEQNRLYMVALAWGIEHADQRDRNDLIVRLEQEVLKGEQEKSRGSKYAKGIKEFIEDVKMGEKTKVRSLVQMAVDKNILHVDKRPQSMGVYWLDQYGNVTDKVITLSTRTKDYWLELTTDYMVNYPNALEIIKGDLKFHDKQQENAVAELGDMSIQYFFDHFYDDDMKTKVREVAMKCGAKPVGKSKPQVRQILLDYFKEHYDFHYENEMQSQT